MEFNGTRHNVRLSSDGILQFIYDPDVIDLGPGYLDPALLPVDILPHALASATTVYGTSSLGYGVERGPRHLREQLAHLSEQWDGIPYSGDEIFVTAGISQILSHLSSTLGRPGDVVLTESTSYDLGCNIFRERGLETHAVTCDESGAIPATLAKAVERLRRAHRRIAFFYVIPTFHNPTGRLMPLARRQELLEVTSAHRVLVVEDNAYRAVVLDDVAVPASLFALSQRQGVIQVSSFSKCLAPGLRLGWLTAAVSITDQVAGDAMFRSGGGVNHLIALVVSELIGSGWFAGHCEKLCRSLAARRGALLSGLEQLPTGYEFAVPHGGFFVWLTLPPEVTEVELCAAARRQGVAVVPGGRFGTETGGRAVRVCFSFHPPSILRRAATKLAVACRAPATEVR